MPAKSYKLGPGTLTLGAGGTLLDLSCQITKATVEWDKDKDDDLNTLCGGTVAGETVYKAKLTGTVLQDLELDGVVEYTWENKGAQVPFEYIPSTALGRKVTGTVIVDPVMVGGDVKTRPTSDFEWDCVGEPVLVALP